MSSPTPGQPDDTTGPLDSRQRRALRRRAEATPWKGPHRRYDILKEGTIALVVVVLLVAVLATLFSSPDVPPVTLQAWSSAQPIGFTQIALSELEGTSTSATYGPPYNHGSGSVQDIYGVSIQRAIGVTNPIDPAKDFVVDPLGTVSGQPALKAALIRYTSARQPTRRSWEQAYGRALAKAKMVDARLVVPSGSYGPVGTMLASLLSMARSGGLDDQLVAHSAFFTTNYTNPLLFIGDAAVAQPASYWNNIVTAQKMQGHQWGMMNETGSWPGQPWLWLYVMWYQIPPMSSSHNGDVEVIAIMTVLSLGLVFVPFIPGIRDLPRWIPVHRLVWKDYYRTYGSTSRGRASGGTSPPTASTTAGSGDHSEPL
ncbi:MAG: hypothetical protein ACYCST_03605 [Acidimicrobiales bacterium]